MAEQIRLQDPQFRELVEAHRVTNKLKDPTSDPHLVQFLHNGRFCFVQSWPKQLRTLPSCVEAEWEPGKYHLENLEMAVWFKPPFDLRFEFLSMGRYFTAFGLRNVRAWDGIDNSPFGIRRWYSRCGFEYEVNNHGSRSDNPLYRTFHLMIGEDSSGMRSKLLEIALEHKGITGLRFNTSPHRSRNKIHEVGAWA